MRIILATTVILLCSWCLHGDEAEDIKHETPAYNSLQKNTPRPLAEYTSGEQFLFIGKSSFDSIFVNLANQCRNTYLISFNATGTGSGFYSVQIRLRNTPKDVIVRSRNGYRIYSVKKELRNE